MSDFGADPDPELNKFRTVAFRYNFVPLDNLKVDQFSTTTADKVYKFVRKIGSTRLKFRVDPTLVQG